MRSSERAALIGQVLALRNVVDGILASLQEAQDTDVTSDCEHPKEQRKYAGGMGDARYTCGVCGETITVTPEGA